MSHVATVDVEITNLDWLEKACRKVGLEFWRDQRTYRWFGKHVGDYPLPTGFSKDELGKCRHALGLPSSAGPQAMSAYQVGVVPRRDGRPGWSLLWDFFNGGCGLRDVVGENCSKLVQAYSTVAARETAIRQGMRVTEQQLADGSIRLVMSK